MKQLLAPFAILLAICCAGCGDTHESLVSEGLSTLKDMVSVLEGIKDKATAQSAKPKLKALAEKMNDIQKRQEKLGKPSEADKKAMEDKHKKEMEELMPKLFSNMMRIGMDPQISAELGDLDEIMKPMK